MRAWYEREFTEAGIDFARCKPNMGPSAQAGTIRGTHPGLPALEAKLVRCTRSSL
jgi:dTDP-4-dehydrorhamnose 3,5-epimerase-like enzyme